MTPAMALPVADERARPLVLRASSTITHGDLDERTDALAAKLEAGRVTRVLVCSEDVVDIVRSVEACRRCGADLWVAHTTLSSACIDDIIGRFGIQAKIARTDEIVDTPDPRPPASGHIHLMTSGTTGQPKIAVHTPESLQSRIRGSAALQANQDGRWLLTYQPTAFAGIQVILTALLSNGVLVVPEERTPVGFYEAAVRHKATHISGTPTFWRAFLLVAQPGALDLRQITVGGEAVDQVTLDRLKVVFPAARITHIYASTEAGVVFAVHDGTEGFPAEWLDRPVQGGSSLRIRDGILQAKTPHAMRGYAAGSGQAAVDDDWLVTGDLVEVQGDRVRFLGRRDDIINVGGSKVYPQAVETVLLSTPGVVEAQVRGVPNPITGFFVGADVVLAVNEDPEAARVRILADCRAKLPAYQVPRILKFVDAIAVQASGKKA
jgi:acyl-CoA synthetase (AMP-forming)/AMP-acid ligase II